MIFVPLPFVATLLLVIALAWFVTHREMSHRPHQLFAGLVFAYGLQSVLLCMRWGYDIADAGLPIAILAPVLPCLAWLAYKSLAGFRNRLEWWPLGVVVLNWLVLATYRDLVDATILMTFIGFGALMLHRAAEGEASLALSPVIEARQILIAMRLTGAALILSGIMDVFVIYDFMRNEGRNVGTAVTIAQTFFILLIGIAATFGHSATQNGGEAQSAINEAEHREVDSEIIARLEKLFGDQIHRDEDLSLRRLARRLQVPDRRVSNAINRVKGLNVSQYVNEFRIKDACQMLAETDQGVLKISLAVGFTSKSNFNREFFRVTEETPSQWRQRVRGSGNSVRDR